VLRPFMAEATPARVRAPAIHGRGCAEGGYPKTPTRSLS
jgi:hypothetical protein